MSLYVIIHSLFLFPAKKSHSRPCHDVDCLNIKFHLTTASIVVYSPLEISPTRKFHRKHVSQVKPRKKGKLTAVHPDDLPLLLLRLLLPPHKKPDNLSPVLNVESHSYSLPGLGPPWGLPEHL